MFYWQPVSSFQLPASNSGYPMMTLSPDIPKRRDIPDSAWRISSAAGVTIALLALLAVTLIVAVAFKVNTGIWLRIWLAALAYNLTLRLANQARHAWLVYHRVQPLPPFPADLPVEQITLSGPLDATLARVQDILDARYQIVAAEHDATRAQLHAERHRLAAWWPALVYVGSLLVLLGLLINDATGWRATDIALAPNSSATLAQAGGLQITLNEITGTEPRATSTLILTQADGRARTVHVVGNRPARWGNFWIIQRATGPALAVSAQDANGRPLLLQALISGGEVSEHLHIPFGQTQTEQGFAIPTRDLAFRVVSYPALPERDIASPVFLVEAYHGDEPAPVLSELVEDEAILALDDLTLTLRRDHHATLEATCLPGLGPLFSGGLLALVGLGLTLVRGYAEAWGHLAVQGETVIATLSASACAFAPLSSRRELAHLVQALEHTASPNDAHDTH